MSEDLNGIPKSNLELRKQAIRNIFETAKKTWENFGSIERQKALAAMADSRSQQIFKWFTEQDLPGLSPSEFANYLENISQHSMVQGNARTEPLSPALT